jgi:hypothetical protein
MSKSQSYELFLPVFKQGDDLAHHLEKNPQEPAKALLGLAEQYEATASICRRVAAVVAETPPGSVSIMADTHLISIDGPSESFAGLVSDGILTVPEQDEEDEGIECEDGLDQ